MEDNKENNLLITKFMGIEIVKRNDLDAVYVLEDASHPEYFSLSIHNRYHKDWNLLMTVVKKIGLLYDETHLQHRGINNLTIFSPIERVYEGVINFINWYNQNIKK